MIAQVRRCAEVNVAFADANTWVSLAGIVESLRVLFTHPGTGPAERPRTHCFPL
ncbi:hypothetical protein [Rhodococcus tibetensis]|uniref:Uncharacterized protein n=1 Tax=Rhodococcus tibetensis TaxID=2965064 RepID=A0ABT1QG92_9NOCA|nr:hypothetical protein [Rhodococcus sp. FXJ9.536]MCQ4121299.1 hypothetical protein [Rhodococcus sp. FXJ9.536]